MVSAMAVGRRLGKTDIEITPIGLGCAQMSTSGVAAGVYPPADAEAVVRASLAGGVNWFDTAEGYGGSEQTLNAALGAAAAKPGEVVIATKWLPFGRWASNIQHTIGERIHALQDYPIDLYQVHQATGFSSVESEMREMAKLLRAKKIQAVGVSNFNARQMVRAATALRAEGVALASNQVSINLLDRSIERNGVLEAARDLGTTLIAYAPLRAGFLTGRFHDDPQALRKTHWLRRLLMFGRAADLTRTRPLIEELGRIAKAHGVSRAQVALNWVINFYGDTVVAIPGASKSDQAEENAGAQAFRLTDNELGSLANLSR